MITEGSESQHLAFVPVGHETQRLGDAPVEVSKRVDRVGAGNLAHGTIASGPYGRRSVLTPAVRGHDQTIIPTGAVVRRRGMGLMVRDDVNRRSQCGDLRQIAGRANGQHCSLVFVATSERGQLRLPLLCREIGCENRRLLFLEGTGVQRRQRSAMRGNDVNLVEREASHLQHRVDRSPRYAVPELHPVEALFAHGSHGPSVPDYARRCVRQKCDPENVHDSPITGTTRGRRWPSATRSGRCEGSRDSATTFPV